MAPTVYWAPTMRTEPAGSATEPVAPVPTPPNVPDVTPSLCLSLVAFKDMLRQFRAADDGVVLRLNRAFAQSRDAGSSVPPSLLQHHDARTFSSATASDIGRSTYASTSDAMCATIWAELVRLWKQREDTIKYCIAVNAQHAPAPLPTADARLDLDRPAPPPRLSRSETDAEFTTRQLRNELAIESIVRLRSLEGMSLMLTPVFKSRCRLFTPQDELGQTYFTGK